MSSKKPKADTTQIGPVSPEVAKQLEAQTPTAELVVALRDELSKLQVKYDRILAENIQLREHNCLREITVVLDKYRCAMAIMESQIQVKALD